MTCQPSPPWTHCTCIALMRAGHNWSHFAQSVVTSLSSLYQIAVLHKMQAPRELFEVVCGDPGTALH